MLCVKPNVCVLLADLNLFRIGTATKSVCQESQPITTTKLFAAKTWNIL